MPDIRNFFGGKGSQGTPSGQEKPLLKGANKAESLKRKRNARKVIDDSDEDDYSDSVKKTTPKKSTPQKRVKKETLEGEETTTADYYQASTKAKPSKSGVSKARPANTPVKEEDARANTTPRRHSARTTKPVDSSVQIASPNSRSTRRKRTTSYTDQLDDGAESKDGDGDEILAANPKKRRKPQDDDFEDENDFEAMGNDLPQRASGKKKGRQSARNGDEFVPKLEESDTQDIQTSLASKPSKDSGQKVQAKGAKKQSPKKASPKKTTNTPGKKFDAPDDGEVQKILHSIPTVPLPESTEPSGEPSKFDFRKHNSHTAPPAGAGTKELPVGAENCLAGLTFVFTGILDSLGRDEGQELVKRYGGKVTTSPSSKTSYVVLGREAGPKKIEAIRKNTIATIDEDGLFELIRRLPANGGDSKAAAKHEEKRQKEEEKARDMAAQMELEEKQRKQAQLAKSGTTGNAQSNKDASNVENRLWTVKYAPTTMKQICGNKGQVEKLQRWLREWPKSQRIGFKKAGLDGSYCFRAMIIHGPPGIGKTTAAHLVARMEGYDVLESNASDSRSKKLVETALSGILDNTSLLGYFAGDDKKLDANKKKLVLIMDEVDGMSAGDRGGVGALAQVCKKTNIPMILICNERRIPKMKPFDFVTYDLNFRRPTVNEIRSRIASICYREGLKLPTQVIDALVEGSHADIRQIINMISAVKLDQEAMDFDQGKSMSKAWEKHVILKPWDITSKILSSAMFGSTSNKSLNDKIELYFNDHVFSFLMLQENYLKTNPSISQRYSGKERTLKNLELADAAAESISDGDLVDRMIHGPQQHWNLMPVHGVFSFVRPASFVYGSLGQQVGFTSWLGNNSKQGKLSRFVKEIQGHMRLRASGDRHEIRQQYLPTLWVELVKKLQVEGKDAVENVISLMDSYFLTKDDFDAIVELGLGPMDMENVKIETQTKATFTRLYNQRSHPLPFMKASSVVAPKKAVKEKPDLEEAIEEDDDEDLVVDKDVNDEDEEDDVDLSKDKYVKQPKKKAAPKKVPSNAKGKGKGRAKAKNLDDEGNDLEESEEEDVKPAKGRGAKGKVPATKRGGKRGGKA